MIRWLRVGTEMETVSRISVGLCLQGILLGGFLDCLGNICVYLGLKKIGMLVGISGRYFN